MALADAALSKLKKKQAELVLAASTSRPARPPDVPEEATTAHCSLAHCIYKDNRKKVYNSRQIDCALYGTLSICRARYYLRATNK